MIIEIFFEFFLDAKTSSGKEKIFKKVCQNLTVIYGTTAVSHVNEAKFVVSVEVDKWELLVFKTISDSQKLGRQWILTGNIEYECNLWTNHSKLAGVNSISITTDYSNEIE